MTACTDSNGQSGLAKNPAYTEDKKRASDFDRFIRGDFEYSKNLTQLDQDETQRIGSYYFGYITVPVSWIPYKDHNPNDGIYQYWDASRNLIISLILMESTDIEGLADIYISRHEDRVPIEVEYATDQMELDGNPVYHFTCHHLDDSGCCAVYLLHGPSGGTNYIIAEGPTDFILEAINMVEQTFSFEDKQIASLV